ncbi:DNA polymerase III, gamma and tau subunits [Candidatus Vecturithrix granuli]|uniref:DNA polymerase III subunit gamma/tau n=1 Tax=Vecturithrix granuli TaxID=1499967 RepID=A0A081BUI9_VECG1|nr:DNA polymerase III, gamma and tau subunits [Candidatus Vecturithrix granuli]
MTYQVLARKWRPQTFESVVGQEHITDVLKNSLASGRIHHGYLFNGIRGIGKTTTARILAKALNCVHGPTPTPCNQCEFCREIIDGYSLDVEEIDGASNRGVGEVRVLQENTNYAPSRSRYKIFIIDEVHMLTTEAFNALLKTLEEPPPNVVFILATTEPWKIPPTILSRCQQFTFKPGSAAQIMALLKKVVAHEEIAISDDSLALLVKSAGGSVRDGENLLDQVIGFCGNQVRDLDVRYVLGIPDRQLLWEFVTALFTHQSSQIFSLLDRLVNQGYHLRFFCMELMERIRNMIVLKVAVQPDAYLSLFDYNRAELARYASQISLSELQQMYWILAQVEQEMKFSPHPRYLLEFALVRMANVQALDSLEEISAQLQQIQTEIRPSAGKIAELVERVQTETEGQMPTLSATELQQLWEDVLLRVKDVRPPLAARLKQAIPVHLTYDEFLLGFHPDAEFSRQALDDAKNRDILAGVLREYIGRPVRVAATTTETGVSFEAIRKIHDEVVAAIPRPEIKAQQVKSGPPPTERRSRKNNDGWQARASTPRYKPQIQVTVQDVVKLFDGEIEK